MYKIYALLASNRTRLKNFDYKALFCTWQRKVEPTYYVSLNYPICFCNANARHLGVSGQMISLDQSEGI